MLREQRNYLGSEIQLILTKEMQKEQHSDEESERRAEYP